MEIKINIVFFFLIEQYIIFVYIIEIKINIYFSGIV